MAVTVTLKRDVHSTTPQVEPFDGEDDEYWFEANGKDQVLKVYRAVEKTTKTYAPGQCLTVDGKERGIGSAKFRRAVRPRPVGNRLRPRHRALGLSRITHR